MSKILFINLRCLGDIFFSAHLAYSYKKENPHSEISFLVFQESAKSFKALVGIEEIFEIDRKTIITLLKSPLFSPQHAINHFFNGIETVINKKWDIIVNFSNDQVSTNITSSLKIVNPNAKIVGNYKNENKTLVSSSLSAKYLNEVMSHQKTPIHYSDCYSNLTEKTNQRSKGNSIARKSTDQNQEYFFKINNLRKGQCKKVVGIQLKSSTINKDIPFNVIANYIQQISKSNIAIPVLLIAPIQEEINYAKDICDFVGTDIVTYSSDFEQLGSILLNLDLLLTPDTSVKHLADLLEIPMIEYLAEVEQLKQASISDDNCIVIKNGNDLTSLPNDLFVLTQKILYPEANKTYVFSNLILSPRNTNVGVFYSQNHSSHFHSNICEKLFINKTIFYRIFAEKKIPTIKLLKDFKINVKNLVQENAKLRDETTQASRLLLNGLRSLLTGSSDRNASREFYLSLSELLTIADKESYLQPLFLVLKADLENIKEKNPQQNKKDLETIFYELKNQISDIGEIIKEIEAYTQIGPRNRFMEL